MAAMNEGLLVEDAEYDVLVVDDDGAGPVAGAHRGARVSDRLAWSAGRDVATGDPPGSAGERSRPLGRQPRGEPVCLAGGIDIDGVEPKVFEPPRGSRTEVSEAVPAVHDDRA